MISKFSEKFRSSHQRCSIMRDNIHWKTPVLEPLFNKIAGLKTSNFIKKRLQHRWFPVNIVKFLRTPILKNIYDGTASVNSRSAIFQKSLVLHFKLNALASRISWQHTHSVLTVVPFLRTRSIMLGFWFQKQLPRYVL